MGTALLAIPFCFQGLSPAPPSAFSLVGSPLSRYLSTTRAGFSLPVDSRAIFAIKTPWILDSRAMTRQDTMLPTTAGPRCGIRDLPVELLQQIAYSAVPDKVDWTSAQTRHDVLDLRLIHPQLLSIFTTTLIHPSRTISINPRNDAALEHFLHFLASTGTAHRVARLELRAENFVRKTHCLNSKVYEVIKACPNIASLDLILDGHYTEFSEFPVMPKLRSLSLHGESLYTHLGQLPRVAPNLSHLAIMSPTLSGPAPAAAAVAAQGGQTAAAAGPAANHHAFVAAAAAAADEPQGLVARTDNMPPSLTHLHISNLNSPQVANLLVELNFRPVHFSFSLLYNYDLTELAVLLCRDRFCERTLSITMSQFKMVQAQRLTDFKSELDKSMVGRRIELLWPRC